MISTPSMGARLEVRNVRRQCLFAGLTFHGKEGLPITEHNEVHFSLVDVTVELPLFKRTLHRLI
jgi:hypothetical protein